MAALYRIYRELHSVTCSILLAVTTLTDDPGNAIFRRPILMPNGVATGSDVSTKDKIEKEPFGDMIDTVCYGLVRNATFLIRE